MECFLELANRREDWSRENVMVTLRERDVLNRVCVVVVRGSVVPPYGCGERVGGDLNSQAYLELQVPTPSDYLTGSSFPAPLRF
jgi:hypothetical protein